MGCVQSARCQLCTCIFGPESGFAFEYYWLLATGYFGAVDGTTRLVNGCTACRDLQPPVLRAGNRPECTTADCVRVRMRMRIHVSLADELYIW